ncbi:hypothetical protein phiA047_0205 [Aeromonas phage phiA047]|nr:hypothetical protein phiA047_0205 [Aeromonas phage phiA047]
MNFVAWLILCAGLYILPAGIGAFINLDWSYLDFTTWSIEARHIRCCGYWRYSNMCN